MIWVICTHDPNKLTIYNDQNFNKSPCTYQSCLLLICEQYNQTLLELSRKYFIDTNVDSSLNLQKEGETGLESQQEEKKTGQPELLVNYHSPNSLVKASVANSPQHQMAHPEPWIPFEMDIGCYHQQ